jgi:dihydrofolate reductase
MGKTVVEMSMSLDGFIAGPHNNLSQVHDWMFPASGKSDPVNVKNVDDMFASTGVVIMGWTTWSYGDELNDWVKDPPFQVPTFVLVSKLPERAKSAGPKLIFVTDGIASALTQAKTAAGGKNVVINGGANVVQQYIKAGLVDELHIHLVPFLLHQGTRLFETFDAKPTEFEHMETVEATGVTHIVYRVK